MKDWSFWGFFGYPDDDHRSLVSLFRISRNRRGTSPSKPITNGLLIQDQFIIIFFNRDYFWHALGFFWYRMEVVTCWLSSVIAGGRPVLGTWRAVCRSTGPDWRAEGSGTCPPAVRRTGCPDKPPRCRSISILAILKSYLNRLVLILLIANGLGH